MKSRIRIKSNKDNTRMRLYFCEDGVSCLIIKREVNGQSDVNLGDLKKDIPRNKLSEFIPSNKFYMGFMTWDDLKSGNF